MAELTISETQVLRRAYIALDALSKGETPLSPKELKELSDDVKTVLTMKGHYSL
jgi:hypothetical protein